MAHCRDESRWRSLWTGLAHGTWIVVLSVLIINAGYRFEGTGIPLGRFEFASQTLTRPLPPNSDLARPVCWDYVHSGAWHFRINRFRGTWLEKIPVPLPRSYVLGFDDQKLESEGSPRKYLFDDGDPEEMLGYPVYLNGALSEKSWWYYYLLAMTYKVPEGTLALVGFSLILLIVSPRSRASWFDELTLLAVPLIVWFSLSFLTNIALGLRYMLPAFPYMFISAGKVVPWATGLSVRGLRLAASAGVFITLLATVTATAMIHPHYLAYFNTVSGGPIHGSEHLIDSSLDWGQDLVGLRRWLRQNAPREKVGLAYYGQINPQVFNARRGEGFEWFLPPPLPGTMEKPPNHDRYGPWPPPLRPGLYAISVSLLRGLPWQMYNNDPLERAPCHVKFRGYTYFQELKPIAQIGYSIFIYRVT